MKAELAIRLLVETAHLHVVTDYCLGNASNVNVINNDEVFSAEIELFLCI